jgi:hypothetical protein
MPDHIVSILTGVIDSLPAGRLNWCDALFAWRFKSYLTVLCLMIPGGYGQRDPEQR